MLTTDGLVVIPTLSNIFRHDFAGLTYFGSSGNLGISVSYLGHIEEVDQYFQIPNKL